MNLPYRQRVPMVAGDDTEYTHLGAAAQVSDQAVFVFACIYTSGGDV